MINSVKMKRISSLSLMFLRLTVTRTEYTNSKELKMHLKFLTSEGDMIYSDLHCDTLTRCFEKKESILTATGHINALKSEQLSEHRQCFALFVPDSKSGSTAFSYLAKLVSFYEREKKKLEGTSVKPVLTVENGRALGGDSDNVFYLSQKGVRMLTLTWNGENELAFGCGCDEGGLKPFGR